jgi:hypothetical protein
MFNDDVELRLHAVDMTADGFHGFISGPDAYGGFIEGRLGRLTLTKCKMAVPEFLLRKGVFLLWNGIGSGRIGLVPGVRLPHRGNRGAVNAFAGELGLVHIYSIYDCHDLIPMND